jgi:hypothetical protein
MRIIGRVLFRIESITLGNQQDGMLVRYRGRLRVEDTAKSYDQLAAQLAPYNITPLFRWEDETGMPSCLSLASRGPSRRTRWSTW